MDEDGNGAASHEGGELAEGDAVQVQDEGTATALPPEDEQVSSGETETAVEEGEEARATREDGTEGRVPLEEEAETGEAVPSRRVGASEQEAAREGEKAPRDYSGLAYAEARAGEVGAGKGGERGEGQGTRVVPLGRGGSFLAEKDLKELEALQGKVAAAIEKREGLRVGSLERTQSDKELQRLSSKVEGLHQRLKRSYTAGMLSLKGPAAGAATMEGGGRKGEEGRAGGDGSSDGDSSSSSSSEGHSPPQSPPPEPHVEPPVLASEPLGRERSVPQDDTAVEGTVMAPSRDPTMDTEEDVVAAMEELARRGLAAGAVLLASGVEEWDVDRVIAESRQQPAHNIEQGGDSREGEGVAEPAEFDEIWEGRSEDVELAWMAMGALLRQSFRLWQRFGEARCTESALALLAEMEHGDQARFQALVDLIVEARDRAEAALPAEDSGSHSGRTPPWSFDGSLDGEQVGTPAETPDSERRENLLHEGEVLLGRLPTAEASQLGAAILASEAPVGAVLRRALAASDSAPQAPTARDAPGQQPPASSTESALGAGGELASHAQDEEMLGQRPRTSDRPGTSKSVGFRLDREDIVDDFGFAGPGRAEEDTESDGGRSPSVPSGSRRGSDASSLSRGSGGSSSSRSSSGSSASSSAPAGLEHVTFQSGAENVHRRIDDRRNKRQRALVEQFVAVSEKAFRHARKAAAHADRGELCAKQAFLREGAALRRTVSVAALREPPPTQVSVKVLSASNLPFLHRDGTEPFGDDSAFYVEASLRFRRSDSAAQRVAAVPTDGLGAAAWDQAMTFELPDAQAPCMLLLRLFCVPRASGAYTPLAPPLSSPAAPALQSHTASAAAAPAPPTSGSPHHFRSLAAEDAHEAQDGSEAPADTLQGEPGAGAPERSLLHGTERGGRGGDDGAGGEGAAAAGGASPAMGASPVAPMRGDGGNGDSVRETLLEHDTASQDAPEDVLVENDGAPEPVVEDPDAPKAAEQESARPTTTASRGHEHSVGDLEGGLAEAMAPTRPPPPPTSARKWLIGQAVIDVSGLRTGTTDRIRCHVLEEQSGKAVAEAVATDEAATRANAEELLRRALRRWVFSSWSSSDHPRRHSSKQSQSMDLLTLVMLLWRAVLRGNRRKVLETGWLHFPARALPVDHADLLGIAGDASVADRGTQLDIELSCTTAVSGTKETQQDHGDASGNSASHRAICPSLRVDDRMELQVGIAMTWKSDTEESEADTDELFASRAGVHDVYDLMISCEGDVLTRQLSLTSDRASALGCGRKLFRRLDLHFVDLPKSYRQLRCEMWHQVEGRDTTNLTTTGCLDLAPWETHAHHHHHHNPDSIPTVPTTLFQTVDRLHVTITVVSARYLRSLDPVRLCNPVCEVMLGGSLLHTTSAVTKTLDPTWEESCSTTATLTDYLEEDVTFDLLQPAEQGKHRVGSSLMMAATPEPLGRATLPMRKIAVDKPFKQWLPLKQPYNSAIDNCSGEVLVRIEITPNSPRGQLMMFPRYSKVIEATGKHDKKNKRGSTTPDVTARRHLESDEGKMVIKIERIKSLPTHIAEKSADGIFVLLSASPGGEMVAQTPQSVDGTWNEDLSVTLPSGTKHVVATLHTTADAEQFMSGSSGLEACDQFGSQSSPSLAVGSAVIKINELAAGSNFRGELPLDCGATTYKLTILVESAKGLIAADRGGTSDPYVKASIFKDQKQIAGPVQTKVIEKTLNPEWKQALALPVVSLHSEILIEVLDYDQYNRDDPIGVTTIPVRLLEERYRKLFSEVPTETFPSEGEALRIASQRPSHDLGNLASASMQLPEPPLRRQGSVRAVQGRQASKRLLQQPSAKVLGRQMTAKGLVKRHTARQLAGGTSLIRQGTLARAGSVRILDPIMNDQPKIATAVLTERYDPNRDRSYPVVMEKYEPPQAKRPDQRRKDRKKKVKVHEELPAGAVLEAHLGALKDDQKDYLKHALEAAHHGEVQHGHAKHAKHDKDGEWLVHEIVLDEPDGPTGCGGGGEILLKMKLEREFDEHWRRPGLQVAIKEIVPPPTRTIPPPADVCKCGTLDVTVAAAANLQVVGDDVATCVVQVCGSTLTPSAVPQPEKVQENPNPVLLCTAPRPASIGPIWAESHSLSIPMWAHSIQISVWREKAHPAKGGLSSFSSLFGVSRNGAGSREASRRGSIAASREVSRRNSLMSSGGLAPEASRRHSITSSHSALEPKKLPPALQLYLDDQVQSLKGKDAASPSFARRGSASSVGSKDSAPRTRRGSAASRFSFFTSWLSTGDQKELVGSCTISLQPEILSQDLAGWLRLTTPDNRCREVEVHVLEGWGLQSARHGDAMPYCAINVVDQSIESGDATYARHFCGSGHGDSPQWDATVRLKEGLDPLKSSGILHVCVYDQSQGLGKVLKQDGRFLGHTFIPLSLLELTSPTEAHIAAAWYPLYGRGKTSDRLKPYKYAATLGRETHGPLGGIRLAFRSLPVQDRLDGRVLAGLTCLDLPTPAMSDAPDHFRQECAERGMGIISFSVVAASGLKAADMEGTSDPYCVCRVGSESVRTTTKHKTLSPVWNENFSLPITSADKFMTVSLLDWDRFGGNDELGSVSVPLDSLQAGQTLDGWYRIDGKSGAAGTLIVVVKHATDLPAMDLNGKSDPYCVLHFVRRDGSKERTAAKRTRTISKTLDPVWEETYCMAAPRSDSELRVDLFDWDAIGYDDHLGSVQIPLSSLNPHARCQKAFQIEISPNAMTPHRTKPAMIHLELCYIPSNESPDGMLRLLVKVESWEDDMDSNPYLSFASNQLRPFAASEALEQELGDRAKVDTDRLVRTKAYQDWADRGIHNVFEFS